MEVKDFFSEVKERLTSPLIGSFVIAWIFINWQIPVALIFYNQEEIKLETQNSFISYIKSQYTFLHCFLLPILVSSFYVLIYPYIRNWIAEYVEKRRLQGEAKLLKMSMSEGYVSIAKHQLLQSQVNDKISQLTKFYNEQTTIETKYLEQEAKLAEFESEIATLKSKNQSLNNKKDINIVDKIYSFNIVGKFQVKSFSDPTGTNIMSLSEWEIINYQTVNIRSEFRFSGHGSYESIIKPIQYKILNLSITAKNELFFTIEDLMTPATRYTITILKYDYIQYQCLLNDKHPFTMTKIL